MRVLGRSLDLRAPDLFTTLMALLQQLPSVDWMIILLLEYYPDLERQQGPVPLHIAQRGLGNKGGFPIPMDIWDTVVTADQVQALHAFVPHGKHRVRPPSPTTLALLHALHRDGFLWTDGVPHREGNANAFLRPKSSTKAAFIANLRGVAELLQAPA